MFGLSGKGRIQTEEDRAGCRCEDIVKAGYEHASRTLLGTERREMGQYLWVRHGLHLCEEV